MTVIAMSTQERSGIRIGALQLFWWAFAVRGGLAIVFAGVLRLAADLLGTVFFDPIMLVSISLLLGSYVLGNGVLLGFAAIYARQHHLPVFKVVAAESLFAIVLAGFIAFSLVMTSESLAWLAGLHAFGTGCFQLGMGWRLRSHGRLAGLLGGSGLIALGAAALFLLNRQEPVRTLTVWLSAFELLFGVVLLIFARGLHDYGTSDVSTPAVRRVGVSA